MNQPVADVDGSLAPLSKIPAIIPTAGNVNGKKMAAPMFPKNWRIVDNVTRSCGFEVNAGKIDVTGMLIPEYKIFAPM